MVEDDGKRKTVMTADDDVSAEEWLSRARQLLPEALGRAREVRGFPGRWKMIVTKLEQVSPTLSDLSTHPCFSKNVLFKEQLRSVFRSLSESIELSEVCCGERYDGKLRMQSDLDFLAGKLDLNLRDCRILIKTGVIGEEFLARLQIGHLEDKHKALDCLLEAMEEDEKKVLEALGRNSVTALVQLLTAATSPRIREKAVTVVCSLAAAGRFDKWMVEEGVLPPLIRLVESGTDLGKEKSALSLQRLSSSVLTARAIVGHGGVRLLAEVCAAAGDSVTQSAAACTLKNISVVPEVLQVLVEEGAIKLMIDLLDFAPLVGTKNHAAECLQNLTAGNDDIKRRVVSDGGVRSLLAFLDSHGTPRESTVLAVRNLVRWAPTDELVSLGILPKLARVLRSGPPGAQQAAASSICKLCTSGDAMKLAVSEAGCVPLLVGMLGAKTNGAREVAAEAASALMRVPQIRREVKRDARSVPNLVANLDPNPQNAAKKYAVSCLVILSTSKRCRRLMVAHGAIGYLKKLSEMEVPGAKKLLERLERGRLMRSLFGRH
ncbi:unnamed protein product [Cuscuta campestris]|uniref:DUF7032 domain-containing protein n=1 Tax=Cuscuta campestris TaxID=132261 RepID=A0A484M6T8_9ASTE|nr:unnamed protein product [Cuscuta campestris]